MHLRHMVARPHQSAQGERSRSQIVPPRPRLLSLLKRLPFIPARATVPGHGRRRTAVGLWRRHRLCVVAVGQARCRLRARVRLGARRHRQPIRPWLQKARRKPPSPGRPMLLLLQLEDLGRRERLGRRGRLRCRVVPVRGHRPVGSSRGVRARRCQHEDDEKRRHNDPHRVQTPEAGFRGCRARAYAQRAVAPTESLRPAPARSSRVPDQPRRSPSPLLSDHTQQKKGRVSNEQPHLWKGVNNQIHVLSLG